MPTPAYKTPGRYLKALFGDADHRTVAAGNLELAAEVLALYRMLDAKPVESYEQYNAAKKQLDERADWILKELGVSCARK